MSRFSLLLLLIVGGLSACVEQSVNGNTGTGTTPGTGTGTTVAFSQIQGIFAQRCNGCHSTSPSYSGFGAPAGGLDFTQPAVIKSSASRILRQTVNSQAMPQRNITGMTQAERTLLGQWIAQGANLQ